MISFWVVLILFTIVRTKIIHYSSFCYFPLTFLAAYSVSNMLDGKIAFKGYIRTFLIIISCLFGIALTAVTLFDKIKEFIYPFVTDPYTLNSMKATSQWVGYEPAIGIILILCTIVFCIRFARMKNFQNLSILIVGSIFFIFTTMLSVVGEVEKYSQAPAIDFYIGKKGEDCYIYPREKSYAHYFYSDRQPQNTCDDFDFLSKGNIDKTCYFVIKNNQDKINEFISQIDDVVFLYEENGFVFYARYPK